MIPTASANSTQMTARPNDATRLSRNNRSRSFTFGKTAAASRRPRAIFAHRVVVRDDDGHGFTAPEARAMIESENAPTC